MGLTYWANATYATYHVRRDTEPRYLCGFVVMPNHHPVQPAALIPESLCTKCKSKSEGPQISVLEGGKWRPTPMGAYLETLKAEMPRTGDEGPVWTGD